MGWILDCNDQGHCQGTDPVKARAGWTGVNEKSGQKLGGEGWPLVIKIISASKHWRGEATLPGKSRAKDLVSFCPKRPWGAVEEIRQKSEGRH